MIGQIKCDRPARAKEWRAISEDNRLNAEKLRGEYGEVLSEEHRSRMINENVQLAKTAAGYAASYEAQEE